MSKGDYNVLIDANDVRNSPFFNLIVALQQANQLKFQGKLTIVRSALRVL